MKKKMFGIGLLSIILAIVVIVAGTFLVMSYVGDVQDKKEADSIVTGIQDSVIIKGSSVDVNRESCADRTVYNIGNQFDNVDLVSFDEDFNGIFDGGCFLCLRDEDLGTKKCDGVELGQAYCPHEFENNCELLACQGEDVVTGLLSGQYDVIRALIGESHAELEFLNVDGVEPVFDKGADTLQAFSIWRDIFNLFIDDVKVQFWVENSNGQIIGEAVKSLNGDNVCDKDSGGKCVDYFKGLSGTEPFALQYPMYENLCASGTESRLFQHAVTLKWSVRVDGRETDSGEAQQGIDGFGRDIGGGIQIQ